MQEPRNLLPELLQNLPRYIQVNIFCENSQNQEESEHHPSMEQDGMIFGRALVL
jgi:hypothetical protein